MFPLAAACSKSSKNADPANASDASPTMVDAGAAALDTPHTTSPTIALNNLNIDVANRQQTYDKAPEPEALQRLVDMLLARSQFTGRLSDLEAADHVTLDALPKFPKSGTAHLARANALGAVHEFELALAELAKAEKLGAGGDKIAPARQAIYQAQGKYDDAWKIESATDESLELSPALAARAALVGDMEKPTESERIFALSRAKFRDVSPFMLSWMDFQHGFLLERRGDREGAKKWLAEAHQVNPTYTHAAVHLAGLSTPDEAVTILKPLVDTSDDPDVLAGLADALRRTGKEEEAKPIRARAKMRYEELLAKYPKAFADHAAQFYLGFDGDVAKALTLAKANEVNRKTEASVELLLTASLAANAKDATCLAVKDGLALPYTAPAFRANFAPVAVGCDLDGGVMPAVDGGKP